MTPRWTRKRGPEPGKRWREEKKRRREEWAKLEVQLFGRRMTDDDGNLLPTDPRSWLERLFS